MTAINFSIERFKKGLKLDNYTDLNPKYFSIERFKKGLKHNWTNDSYQYYFSIERFKKGLKLRPFFKKRTNILA